MNPYQTHNPQIPQGPQGHGSQLPSAKGGSWTVSERTTVKKPQAGEHVKAIPYKVESKVGMNSKIPYHLIYFRVVGGEADGFDRLRYMLSESKKAQWKVENFFDEVGYPLEKWSAAHKENPLNAIRFVVQEAKPVRILVETEEAEDGTRYRVIKEMQPYQEFEESSDNLAF